MKWIAVSIAALAVAIVILSVSVYEARTRPHHTGYIYGTSH